MNLRSSIFLFLLCSLIVSPTSVVAQSDASSNQQAANSCVCDCVYLQNSNIRNHRYYSAGTNGSCQVIEGKACIGELRGENFRGQVKNCLAGPTQISTPFSSWFHVRQIAALGNVDAVAKKLATH